jgi:hypothetical protein
MPERRKIRYEIALAPPGDITEPVGFVTRNVVPGDRDALARLMLDAYVGTIDYEGETISDVDSDARCVCRRRTGHARGDGRHGLR